MLLDARFGFFFSFMIVLVSSVIIIIYSSMYTLKDGVVLSIALGVITFIYGISDPSASFVLYPASVLTGLAYSYGLKKDYERKKLLVIAVLIFVVGELISALVILPLVFNLPFLNTVKEMTSMVEEMKNQTLNILNTTDGAVGGVIDAFNLAITEIMKHIYSICIVATAFTGAAEGLLIHLLSIILLKRFKIKDIRIVNFIDMKPNIVYAYIAFIVYAFNFFLGNRIQINEIVYGLLLSISYLSFIYLIFFGYMFLITYWRFKKATNSVFLVVVLVILLMPLSLMILMIIGFLYGAGPLYDKLQEIRMNYEKNNTI